MVYVCPRGCFREFQSAQGLTSHVRNHHGHDSRKKRRIEDLEIEEISWNEESLINTDICDVEEDDNDSFETSDTSDESESNQTDRSTESESEDDSIDAEILEESK